MNVPSLSPDHAVSRSARCLATTANHRILVCGIALLLVLSGGARVFGAISVAEICRLKGQERNTLQGMGLVVGLKGTGDGSFGPTTRSLIQIMNNMGIPMTSGATGASGDTELKDAKNVALVVVTAEVPEQGGRQGDEFNCTVSAVNAKSLKGGVLLLTPMLGPVPPGARPENALVYAFARGAVQLDDEDNPTTAKITVGCRMERSLVNPFVKDDKITLVLNHSHARFEVAQEVAYNINEEFGYSDSTDDSGPKIARPIDQLSIEISIPTEYRSRTVAFATRVLEVKLPQSIPSIETVVINETTGAITMSANLEIAPNALQHKNMTIDIGNGIGASQFVELDPAADTAVPTLQALVQSLNALRVSAQDMIAIIRVLDRAGFIHGRVIYER